MKVLILLMTLLFLPSCAAWQAWNQKPLNAALCVGTEATRIEHAKALLNDGGKVSRATGAILLGQMNRGCSSPLIEGN